MSSTNKINSYNFFLKAERTTPQVSIDDQLNEMRFSGRCSPEMVVNFFKPIEEAIDRYFEQGKDSLTAHFSLEYINTSSTKGLINLMRRMDKIVAKGKKIEIYWYYEEDDEDMMETGEDFSDLLMNIEIHIHEFQEGDDIDPRNIRTRSA
ncbi:MAG: DUF1987 domain-containing protein [Cyclobacteriaceae bacterium]